MNPILAFLIFALPATAAPALETERTPKEMAASVLPAGGYQSKVALGDSVVKLVQAGVLDAKKFEAIYAQRGGMPEELKNVLSKPSHHPILLTRTNASGWQANVARTLEARGLLPAQGGARCDV